MNAASIVIVAIIVILAGLALFFIIASRKKGTSPCHGCAFKEGCPGNHTECDRS